MGVRKRQMAERLKEEKKAACYSKAQTIAQLLLEKMRPGSGFGKG